MCGTAKARVVVCFAGVALGFSNVARAADPPVPKAAPAASAPATAQPPANDVVRLKNGGLLRGSIAELVPGEFVVIVLITGETRRIPAADFSYAGPERDAADEGAEEEEEEEEQEEEVEEAKPRPRPRSRSNAGSMDMDPGELVRVQSTSGALWVYSRAPATGRGKRFEQLCKTPCEVSLAPGDYELALSDVDSTDPVAARQRVQIEGTTNLEATYESREALRTAGVVVLLLGTVGGGVIAFTADKKCEGMSSCPRDPTQVAIGVLVAAGSLAAGIVMATRSDIVEIDIVPSAAALVPARGALAGARDPLASPLALPGLSVSARF